MLHDSLANALSLIYNNQKVGMEESVIRPASKTIKKVIEIMNSHNYIGSFEEIKSTKGNMIKVNLLGTINKCGTIKPRYSVEKGEYEAFEKRYLPAKDFGILIISTNQGIMTHNEAKKKGIGGVLLAFCY